MEKLVIFDGEEVSCQYFFDIDEQSEGVEVYYTRTNTLVGVIYDKTLPDADDEEDIENFDLFICEWLKLQDVNYMLE